MTDGARAYWAAGLIGVSAAFLFCGYELVRSPANTLFKAAYGKEGLPYVMAATPLAVVAMLYIYGRLLSWIGPRWTLTVSTVGSCVILAGSYGAIALEWRPGAAILYVMREAYIVLLMEQYWSFLNSTLGDAHARKLNGPICGIGSAGSIVGGLLVASLATKLGTAALLLLGAGITLPTAFLADLAYRRCGVPVRRPEEQKSDTLGVKLFGSQPLLVILLAVILLTQAISGLTDLAFQGILQDAIPDADKQTAFSGWFYTGLNASAAVMQFIVTPLVVWLIPLRLVHLAIPLLHLGACAYLFGSPTLFSAGLAYLLFKVVDYSVFRAAKEVLYIPLSYDSRYRAKELIDVFGYRFGKGGMSLVVLLMQKARMVVSEPRLGLLAAMCAAAWAGLALPLGRRYVKARAVASGSRTRPRRDLAVGGLSSGRPRRRPRRKSSRSSTASSKR